MPALNLLWQPGSLIGDRFEIESVAGSGGMSTIYRARDLRTGDRVALKRLQVRSSAQHDVGRFVREAHVLSELHHPAIVRYIQHGQSDDGSFFLAMEWLEGEDLSQRLVAGPLSIAETISIGRQVATALKVAHQHGIVHRDIKPSNLFLRDRSLDRVMLLDFGIARHTLALRPMTGTGVVVGTPEYMSPEQARGQRDIGPAADVFSLGCVLYECLAGRPPFVGEHFAGLLARILFEDAPPVSTLRAVPAELDQLLAQMLKKDPAARVPDAESLLEAIATVPRQPRDGGRPSSPPPPLAMTDSELVLVSVVIAAENERSEADLATLDAADSPQTPQERQLLTWTLSRFRAQIEWLADGSLCATLARPDSATDQVIQAARLALVLHERWPTATVALATGRGRVHEHLPVGEAIDRAVRLLRQQEAVPEGPDAPAGVWIDRLSADLLDTRFTIVDQDGGQLLTGERTTTDETRLLLGKPTPCVGREQELDFLETALQITLGESESQAVLIQGGPGMGKSRLRHEFLRRIQSRGLPIEVMLGCGDPMSASSPYGLLAGALRRLCGLIGQVPGSDEELDRQRLRLRQRVAATGQAPDCDRVTEFLGELCGLPFPDESSVKLRAARNDPQVMSDQVSRAFLDFLGAEAAAHPLLLVLEDLHWGDPLSVRLVDLALRELAERPFMVLALGRPEVNELFPRLWAGRLQELHLRGLGRRACERLAQQILGPRVSSTTIAEIVTQADGNALFLEELIRAVAAGKRDGRPETVLAMLQARMQRLEPAVRRILRCASIFGETFWREGVAALHSQRLPAAELDAKLAHLVDGELIERHRESRLPGVVQYSFRHGLVRDAAYSLLPDEDRRIGHRLAGLFLAQAGECDPMVVANHFRLGGDNGRAVPYLIRAAEQALASNDLGETLARVGQGIACGAVDEQLGLLKSLGCAAHFWSDDFAAGYPLGSVALKLLPPGSLRWMLTLGHMLTITSLTGKLTHFGELVGAFSSVEPAADARGAYVEAASLLVSMFSFGGARQAASGFLSQLVDKGGRALTEDPLSRGWWKQAHAIYTLMLEPDPQLAGRLAAEGLQAATAASARRMQVLSGAFLGMALSACGDHTAAERQLRDTLQLAQRLGEPMPITHAKVWLASVLSARGDPDALAEAHTLAEATLASPGANVFYLGSAQHLLARYRLASGDLVGAEAAAEAAAALLQSLPTLRGHALSTHIAILRAAGRSDGALALCAAGEELLAQAGCLGYAELPLRVSLLDTYVANGRHPAAQQALAQAYQALATRMERMGDAASRDRFLNGLPENVRLRELAASPRLTGGSQDSQ